MKQNMISIVVNRLNEFGIASKLGEGTDIAISCEFLDVGWSTGNKKITYEASAYFDEANRTVFLWEFTKEIGSGLSFGGDTGSSFQTGKTLFRKVKSVQYGPEGKVFEYTLDLGAIPKAFKEVAKANGWKFKTVLRREKALYPPGYVPAGTVNQPNQVFNQTPPIHRNMQYPQQPPEPVQRQDSAGAIPVPLPVFDQQQANNLPQQQQFNNPNGAFYVQSKSDVPGRKKGVLFWLSFILVAIFTVLLYILSATALTGWALSAAVFFLVFLLHRKFTGQGWVAGIVMWILALVLLFFIFAFTTDTSEYKSNDVKQTISTSNNSVVSQQASGGAKSAAGPSLDENAISPQVDEISMGDYFQKILAQVKKDWKNDAKITSIRFDKSGVKGFETLQQLKVDANWKVVFFSLSTNNEIAVDLDNSKKDANGVPIIKYSCEIKKPDSLTALSLTADEIKNNTNGAKISEFSRPEFNNVYKNQPDNFLVGSDMKMSEILKKLFTRFKNEKITGEGYYLTLTGINGPKLNVYWINGNRKTRYFIELDTKKDYDQPA